MTTKKLYKFRTKTVLNETFEVEAESYDQAIDFIHKGADNHEDDYPSQAERTGWWYDDKEFVELIVGKIDSVFYVLCTIVIQ